MQYLSQRLAARPGEREGERPRDGFGASQRERILSATERLIGEKGWAGTTITGIVDVAGVSSVTFYEHFHSKEECFVAAFDRAVEETRAQLGEAASSDLSWPDQVREGLRVLLGRIAAEPARARMCLVEAQMGGPALRARYEAVLDGAAPKLREGRTLAPAPMWLSDTLEEATVGGLAWLLRQELELGRGADVDGLEALLPRMIDLVLSPYLGEAQAATDGG